MKSIFQFNNEQQGVVIQSDESGYISGETDRGSNARVFHIELLNTEITILIGCDLQVIQAYT